MVLAVYLTEFNIDRLETPKLEKFQFSNILSFKRTRTSLNIAITYIEAMELDIIEFCKLNDIIYNIGAYYSESDYSESEFYYLEGATLRGYPQPEDEFLDNRANYYQFDCSNRQCSFGKVQTGLIRLGELKRIENLKMFMSNWIVDEIFVKLEYYEKYFKPLGIDCKPVLKSKGKEMHLKLVQLSIPIVNCDIEHFLDNTLDYTICKDCSNKIYSRTLKNYYPLPSIIPKYPIWKPNINIGGGARPVIYNKEFHNIIETLGVDMFGLPCRKFENLS